MDPNYNNPDSYWQNPHHTHTPTGNSPTYSSSPPPNVHTPASSSASSSQPFIPSNAQQQHHQQQHQYPPRASGSPVPTTRATFYPTGNDDYFSNPYLAEEPLSSPEASPMLRPQQYRDSRDSMHTRVNPAPLPDVPAHLTSPIYDAQNTRTTQHDPTLVERRFSQTRQSGSMSGNGNTAGAPAAFPITGFSPPPPPAVPMDIDTSYAGDTDIISPITATGSFPRSYMPGTPVSPLHPRSPSISEVTRGTSTRRTGSINTSNRTSTLMTPKGMGMATVKEDEVIDMGYDPSAPLTGEGSHGRGSSRSRLDPQKQEREELLYVEEGGGWIKRSATRMLKSFPARRRSVYGKVIGGDGEDAEQNMLRRASRMGRDEKKARDEGFDAYDNSHFDSAIPERTHEAMSKKHGDSDFAYSDKGEIFDLSSLQGLGGEWRNGDDDMSDTMSLRADTGFEPREKSFYFPEDKDMPNWKPFTMRPLYLGILMSVCAGIIACIELLYQFSVRKGLRHQPPREPYLSEFISVEELPLTQYAMWKYVPTVVAVVFGVMTQLTDSEVKRVEPYFQLSRRPKGALAADSLNIEYLTFWVIFTPIQALRHKHWAAAISSVISLLCIIILPPLQSAFLQLEPDIDIRRINHGIPKQIIVHHIFARLLEAVLGVVFILLFSLMIVIHRRKTGLVGDPSGIAGVAAMANKSHILPDFKGLDRASEDEIHKQLNKRTYILHKSSLWQGEFLKQSLRNSEPPQAQNPHPLLLRLKGGIPFMIYLALIIALFPSVVRYQPLTVILTDTPWLLTAISVTIKSLWDVIDRDLRILEPFYLLYKRHADSSVLTLDYTATIPGWLVFKASQNGHYLLAGVGSISILTEVLTVCVGSLDPDGGEETAKSAKASLWLCESILGIILIGCTVVYILRRHAFLPRQPATISSVLAFIHQSNMLTDFGGTETMTTEERRVKLAGVGKRYGFGWFKGRDGERHLGIDQEELERGYRHGEDFVGTAVMDKWVDVEQY